MKKKFVESVDNVDNYYYITISELKKCRKSLKKREVCDEL